MERKKNSRREKGKKRRKERGGREDRRGKREAGGKRKCESWFLPVSLTSILDPLVSLSSSRIKPASNSTEDVCYTMPSEYMQANNGVLHDQNCKTDLTWESIE